MINFDRLDVRLPDYQKGDLLRVTSELGDDEEGILGIILHVHSSCDLEVVWLDTLQISRGLPLGITQAELSLTPDQANASAPRNLLINSHIYVQFTQLLEKLHEEKTN